MARVVKNIITEGLQGSIGHLTFRRRGAKTFISARQVASSKPRSAGQNAQVQRFREAAQYAHCQKRIPAVWEAYRAIAREKHSNPFAVAISDFMNGLLLLKQA